MSVLSVFVVLAVDTFVDNFGKMQARSKRKLHNQFVQRRKGQKSWVIKKNDNRNSEQEETTRSEQLQQKEVLLNETRSEQLLVLNDIKERVNNEQSANIKRGYVCRRILSYDIRSRSFDPFVEDLKDFY